MKPLKLLTRTFLLFFLLGTGVLSAQVGINEDNIDPDASAMLDVQSTDKGLLIPRLTTAERDNIPTPASGLMIYNTDDNAFHYFDGTTWTTIRSGWSLTGNSGTDTLTNFIGTVDSMPLDFRVNNHRVMRILNFTDTFGIRSPSYIGGHEEILRIRPVSFHYNQLSGYDTESEHIGIIAQELQEIAPYMVSTFEKEGAEYLEVTRY